MSPAHNPGDEALERLLAATTTKIKLVDNRCFCPGALGVGIPHVKGMPRGCEHYEPVTFLGRGG